MSAQQGSLTRLEGTREGHSHWSSGHGAPAERSLKPRRFWDCAFCWNKNVERRSECVWCDRVRRERA